jgi:hypothetical protein
VSRFRCSLLWGGLAGLALDGLLAGLCTWLVDSDIVPVLLPQPLIGILLAIFLGAFSLAEIPVMILAMRHLAKNRPDRPSLVLGLNALFCFFAGIYAAPLLLLTAHLGWGWALAGLGILRLAASLLFVHRSHPPSLAGEPTPGGVEGREGKVAQP